MSNVAGKGFLSCGELEEVLLDIGCMMSNRYYVLTWNKLLKGEIQVLLEEDLEKLPENIKVRERLEYIHHENADWKNTCTVWKNV